MPIISADDFCRWLEAHDLNPDRVRLISIDAGTIRPDAVHMRVVADALGPDGKPFEIVDDEGRRRFAQEVRWVALRSLPSGGVDE